MELRRPEALGGQDHCHLGSFQLVEAGHPARPHTARKPKAGAGGQDTGPALGCSSRGSCQVGKHVSHSPQAWPLRAAPPLWSIGSSRPRWPRPQAREGQCTAATQAQPQPHAPWAPEASRHPGGSRVSLAWLRFPSLSAALEMHLQPGQGARRSRACQPCNSAWTRIDTQHRRRRQAGVRLAACSLQHPLASTNRGQLEITCLSVPRKPQQAAGTRGRGRGTPVEAPSQDRSAHVSTAAPVFISI